jgi:hypothetical protein
MFGSNRNDRGEQSVERERRITSELKQRFLAAATLTVTFDWLALMVAAISSVRAEEPLRLGIAHLLIWTVGIAAGVRAYQALMPDLQVWVVPLGVAYTFVMGVASGTFVSGTAVIAYWRFRHGCLYPRLPGHWLLIVGFAAVLANAVAIAHDQVRLLSYTGAEWAKPQTFWGQFALRWNANGLSLMHQTIVWSLGTAIALAFLRHLRDRYSRLWRLFFCLLFLCSASLFGGYLLALFRHLYLVGVPRLDAWLYDVWYREWLAHSGHVCAASMTLCGLAMSLAVAHDFWCRAHTDWLHWTGVGVWIAIALMQIATFTVTAMYV